MLYIYSKNSDNNINNQRSSRHLRMLLSEECTKLRK